MKPEEIGYMTNLDFEYVKALHEVKDGESLVHHLSQWEYWMDESVKTLKAEDWESLKPLIDDCRTEGVVPEDKHDVALCLLMPERLMQITIFARQYKVPWGCAYIRLKEEKMIDY